MDVFLKILALASALFVLMDGVGNIPVFTAVLKNAPEKNRKKIIVRELLIALIILIFFNLLGNFLLSFIQIEPYTLLISGGLILFMIAIQMIFPTHMNKISTYGKDPLIVPLATPLVAGPAVLAAVMLDAIRETTWISLSAIVIAWIGTAVILLSSSFLNKILGERGLLACEKLMGLILTLIATQMFLDGLSLYIHS